MYIRNAHAPTAVGHSLQLAELQLLFLWQNHFYAAVHTLYMAIAHVLFVSQW